MSYIEQTTSMTCLPHLTTHTAATLLIFDVFTSPIRISADYQFRRHLLMRKCTDEFRLTQQIPSNAFQSRFVSHFRFCNDLIRFSDAVGNVRPIAVPPPDDTALARFQGNSSSAFLIVFVVAAEPSDGAAAFRLLQSRPREQITRMLGIRFPRVTSRAPRQDSFHDLGFSALTRSND